MIAPPKVTVTAPSPGATAAAVTGIFTHSPATFKCVFVAIVPVISTPPTLKDTSWDWPHSTFTLAHTATGIAPAGKLKPVATSPVVEDITSKLNVKHFKNKNVYINNF